MSNFRSVCWCCGRRSGDQYGGKTIRLHKVKDYMLDGARRLTGYNGHGNQITLKAPLCCIHFAAHSREKWRQNTFPGFAEDGCHVPNAAAAPQRHLIVRQPLPPPPARPLLPAERIRELERQLSICQKERDAALAEASALKTKFDGSSILITIADPAVAALWCLTYSGDCHSRLVDELGGRLSEHGNHKLSSKQRVEVLLYAYASGMAHDALARACNVKDGMTGRGVGLMLETVEEELQSWADENVHFLDVGEWVADSQKVFANEEFGQCLFYMVDGTVVEGPDPRDVIAHSAMFNSKHQICAWVFFIVVSPRGRIMYISDIRAGNTHDKTHYDQSSVNDILKEKYDLSNVTHDGKKYTVCLCADKAYPNAIVPEHVEKYVTKSAEETLIAEASAAGKKRKKQPDNLHLDPAVAKIRAVVERVIRRMKQWKILDSHHMREARRVGRVVRIIAALENWFIINTNVAQV